MGQEEAGRSGRRFLPLSCLPMLEFGRFVGKTIFSCRGDEQCG